MKSYDLLLISIKLMTLYAALLLGYTIHFIYCIWGNLRITVAELIAAAASQCRLMPLFASSDSGGHGQTALMRLRAATSSCLQAAGCLWPMASNT